MKLIVVALSLGCASGFTAPAVRTIRSFARRAEANVEQEPMDLDLEQMQLWRKVQSHERRLQSRTGRRLHADACR